MSFAPASDQEVNGSRFVRRRRVCGDPAGEQPGLPPAERWTARLRHARNVGSVDDLFLRM